MTLSSRKFYLQLRARDAFDFLEKKFKKQVLAAYKNI